MTHADVSTEVRGAILLARIRGEIDMSNADGIRTTLERRLDNHQTGAVLDFSEVGYIDSTGIHLLYQLADRMSGRGQELRLVVAEGSPVEDTLRFAGALDSLPRDSTVAAAQHRLAGCNG